MPSGGHGKLHHHAVFLAARQLAKPQPGSRTRHIGSQPKLPVSVQREVVHETTTVTVDGRCDARFDAMFTLGMLVIYRIGFYVPVPGVDQLAMNASGPAGGGLGDLMEYFQLFTGGNLQQSTIFGLGIMPYISASIVFQLLVTVIPSLEKLQQEGESGRRKIQEYTRYATVLLCLVQGTIWINYLHANQFIYAEFRGTILYWLMALVALTAGTVFLMWLGEQIDKYGIGNGISLIIMAGIVARMPTAGMWVFENADFRVASSSDDSRGAGGVLAKVQSAEVAGRAGGPAAG